uniref:NR LBD domain-containing protein n=1 Tax=Panagrellus redivivus TaxID=6233 RepID=A0A7E4W7V3_PANRE
MIPMPGNIMEVFVAAVAKAFFDELFVMIENMSVGRILCAKLLEFRNSCRACRFARCLEAGLNPLLFHSDRGTNIVKSIQPVKQEFRESYSPDLPEDCKQCDTVAINDKAYDMDSEYDHWLELATNASKKLMGSNNLALGTMRIIPQFDSNSVQSVAKYYVLLERLCDKYYDSDVQHLTSEKHSFSLDLPAQNAFDTPRAISARTRIDWKQQFHTKEDFMKRMWCRNVAYYADWCSHLPELSELDECDRITLITDRTVPLIDLILAYKAVQFNVEGLPLSGGSYFPFDMEKQKLIDSSVRPYLYRLVNYLHDEFVIPAKEIGLTEVEYVLMKNIIFFSTHSSISPSGKATITRARNFYRNVLCKTIQSEFPHYTFDEIAQRLAIIMDLIPKIEQARVIEDEDFSVMTIFNIGELKGTLSHDVHIKKGIGLYDDKK